jgi:RNA polymerase sigma-70 factor (ECF subfamily)
VERHSPSTVPVGGGSGAAEDRRLVDALRAGDEDAFVQVVRLHGPTMLRVAKLYVTSTAVAEEVVQETWLAVLSGIERFESRSSFKTWLFRILTNRAKTWAAREGRNVSFAALTDEELGVTEVSVDEERFRGSGDRFAHHWTSSPERWSELPEASLLAHETMAVVERAAASLPLAQRAVVTLRDIAGWDADDVCELLGLSATNQRVLLHRARTKVRRALELHLVRSH